MYCCSEDKTALTNRSQELKGHVIRDFYTLQQNLADIDHICPIMGSLAQHPKGGLRKQQTYYYNHVKTTLGPCGKNRVETKKTSRHG